LSGNLKMLDWDLIRYFLAVARSGSTLTAARELGQSQPTVARRIAALEDAVGACLFERRQAGYRPTEDGCALMPEAEAVEAAALRFNEQAHSRKRRVAGTVRITAFDMFEEMGLGQALQEFGQRYPEVTLEIVVTERFLDLAAGEADIAIRAGSRPDSGPFVCRKLSEDYWTLYCSRSYADAHGKPTSPAELNGHVLLGGGGHLESIAPFRWLARNARDVPIRYRYNNVPNLIAAVASGLGVSMLPCAFVDHRPELVRCLPPPVELKTPIWMIVHERMRHEPRIRAMIDFLGSFAMRKSASAAALESAVPAPRPANLA
jgi:DNA-binding transcriptional LysR family regulator